MEYNPFQYAENSIEQLCRMRNGRPLLDRGQIVSKCYSTDDTFTTNMHYIYNIYSNTLKI